VQFPREFLRVYSILNFVVGRKICMVLQVKDFARLNPSLPLADNILQGCIERLVYLHWRRRFPTFSNPIVPVNR
jgi:hypothetical protein